MLHVFKCSDLSIAQRSTIVNSYVYMYKYQRLNAFVTHHLVLAVIESVMEPGGELRRKATPLETLTVSDKKSSIETG